MTEFDFLTKLLGAGGGISFMGLLGVGIYFWSTGKIKIGESANEMPEWASNLVQHFNHDTTEMLQRLISMEEKEKEEADKSRDVQKDILRTLAEIQKYGLPCDKN